MSQHLSVCNLLRSTLECQLSDVAVAVDVVASLDKGRAVKDGGRVDRLLCRRIMEGCWNADGVEGAVEDGVVTGPALAVIRKHAISVTDDGDDELQFWFLRGIDVWLRDDARSLLRTKVAGLRLEQGRLRDPNETQQQRKREKDALWSSCWSLCHPFLVSLSVVLLGVVLLRTRMKE